MKKSFWQNGILLVLVFVVALGGMYLGMATSQRNSEPSMRQEELKSKLTEGSGFPDVNLLDESGNPVHSRELLNDKGTIVLFLEPGCPPCEQMSKRWQGIADDGKLGDMGLISISFAPITEVAKYKIEHGLRFAAYADTSFTFMEKYEVTNYPLMVALDGDGNIRWHTFDANQEIDMKELRENLTM